MLIEGEYNGVLQPGKHYIELKRDFRNLDEVMGAVQRDHLRQTIVERAYQDVILSRRYTYVYFVEHVISAALPDAPLRGARFSWRTCLEWGVYRWTRLADSLTWMVVFIYSRMRDIRDLLRRAQSNRRNSSGT